MSPVEQSTNGQGKQMGKATIEHSLDKAKVKAKENLDMVVQKLNYYRNRTSVLVKDPQFRTITISMAGGAVVLGSAGGAFGTASGIVLGTAAGAVPALFTFGLSLPIGAVVGGGAGLVVGTGSGAVAGGIGGAFAGFGGHKYRVEINNGILTIRKKASMTHGQVKLAASNGMQKGKANVVFIVDGVRQRSHTAQQIASAKAEKLAKLSLNILSSEKFKVTAATGAAGAVVGGGAGAIVGTTTGAALGLLPAIFTFGLSIPVGAAIGCCMGTTSGAAAGAAGGSAVGYGGYTYKKEIRTAADKLATKVKEQTACAKSKACMSAAKVTASIKSYGSTGGTA
jgi:hypothetical protein